jgi:hypothetical protein
MNGFPDEARYPPPGGRRPVEVRDPAISNSSFRKDLDLESH